MRQERPEHGRADPPRRTRASAHRIRPETEISRTPEGRAAQLEALLNAGLEGTFPASDPLSSLSTATCPWSHIQKRSPR